MISIIIILVGATAWGIFGHIEVKKNVAIQSIDGKNYALILCNDLENILSKNTIIIEDKEYQFTSDIEEPRAVSELANVYTKLTSNLKPSDIVYPVCIKDCDLKDVNKGEVIVETITPISFLLSK